MKQFRTVCIEENILKRMRNRPGPFTLKEIVHDQSISFFFARSLLQKMMTKGWIERHEHVFRLTEQGKRKAANIVRLHRLWEVYLSHYLEVGGEKVHRNAEEMEHILTPEIEHELIQLLDNPQQDPHQKPIPAKGEL